MKLPRKEAIKFAEQVRSTIVEVIRRSPEPMTVVELTQSAHISAHFGGSAPDVAYITTLVSPLHKAGMLKRICVYRKGQHSKYAYEFSTAEAAPVVRVPENALPPDVRLTVTRDGALRVAFKGIRIELGVEA